MNKKQIHIRELGPREGFQTLSKIYPTEQKLELINSLSKTGVPEIEVASFVRPDKTPQMADAEQVIAGLPENSKSKFIGLYLNQKGFERAHACQKLQNQTWLYCALSDAFLKSNNNATLDDIFARFPQMLEAFEKLSPGSKLDVDLFKISHHGSKGTTSKELIEKLNCKRYAITTNGSNFDHPDHETIARILVASGEGNELLFNYKSTDNEIWDHATLKDDHKYTAVYPSDNKGLTVDV